VGAFPGAELSLYFFRSKSARYCSKKKFAAFLSGKQNLSACPEEHNQHQNFVKNGAVQNKVG
jgi:hypothetical protein